MRFNSLDLNLLVALDALIAERSVSRAALRMNLTQSAMSNALARLRSHFDDALLVQVGRGFDLTPRAEQLRDPVRDVLVRVDAAILTQPRFDPAQSDRMFRILVSDYTVATLMPHLFALAQEQGVTVRFQLLQQVAGPHRTLERGEADLLLIPEDYCSPDHPKDPLLTEDFACIMWQGNPLAGRELTMEAYLAAGHVEMQPPGGAEAYEAAQVRKLGIPRRVEIAAPSFQVIPALIPGTHRIATVHRRLARQACQTLPLWMTPSPVTLPAMVQVMQWHQFRTSDPGLVWLRQMLHVAARRMDGTTSSDPSLAPSPPLVTPAAPA